MAKIKLGDHWVGEKEPTFFVADIAANHDGELNRAIDLIHLSAEAGADAAKFQHFKAPEIVSDYGFSHMKGQVSHQAKWNKGVTEVYAGASVPWEWTERLKNECVKAGVEFFSAAYDFVESTFK